MRPTHHCPNCGKELGLGDRSEAAPHRTARRLQSLVFPVTFRWTMIVLVGFLLFMVSYHPKGGIGERGLGWMLMCLPAIPGFFLTMLSWFFPKVRIWSCSQCGHVHEVRLKAGHIELPDGAGEPLPAPWMAHGGKALRIQSLVGRRTDPDGVPADGASLVKFRTGRKAAIGSIHCPNCAKELDSGDINKVVPHRIARSLRAAIFPVTLTWFVLLVGGLIVGAFIYHPPYDDPMKGLDWLVLFLGAIPLPWLLLSFLAWFFPRMRVWRCSGCGQVHEARLTVHPAPIRPKDHGPIGNADKNSAGKFSGKPGYERKARGGVAADGRYTK